jgi:monofunctional biosynthetic peptidoglycan transglycosylase
LPAGDYLFSIDIGYLIHLPYNTLKTKNFKKKVLRFIKRFCIFFFVSTIGTALLYRFVPPPVTPLMCIRVVGQAFDNDALKLKKDWVPLDAISNNLVMAVIASEDNHFNEHYGFDFEAIQKAAKMNKHSKRLRGASTITQQTAKNVFLWPDRTWLRKGLEVYFTLLIETTWSKKRIMEVYLNVIEMGNGIYGAEMASQTYFGKSAKNLTKREAALIAAVLPNPRRWNPAHPSAYVQRKQSRILYVMSKLERVDY